MSTRAKRAQHKPSTDRIEKLVAEAERKGVAMKTAPSATEVPDRDLAAYGKQK